MRKVIVVIALLSFACAPSQQDLLKDKCRRGNQIACEQYGLSRQEQHQHEQGIETYCDHGNRVYIKHNFSGDDITAVPDASCQAPPEPTRTPG